MATLMPPYRLNITASILDNLNIGRERPRGGRRRRPNRPRPTTAAPSHDDDHNHGDQTMNTTMASVDQGGKSSSPRTAVEEEDHDLTDGAEPDHGDEDDHDHNTDHEGFSCQPTSSQHMTYIKNNLDNLKKKCDEFHACTVELYNAENFHRVLSGENIQLKNICGLMYANGGGRYTTLSDECSRNERNAIRQDMQDELARNIANPPQGSNRNTWRKLGRCLDSNAGQHEPRINTACRMKRNSTFLCNDPAVDEMTEEFFNHELEHLHCSCKAINAMADNAKTSSSSLSTSVRIGLAGGLVALLVVLIIAVIILCHRHRRMKRKLSQHRMQYLPSPHGEPSAIYQEIGDANCALEALRRARDQGSLPADYHFLGQAPALPDRYVKDISQSRSNLANLNDGSPEYLEPLPDPSSQKPSAHTNDAYNASQSSQTAEGRVEQPYELARNPYSTPSTAPQVPGEGTYFDRINLNRNNEDRGYSQLGRAPVAKGGGGEDGSSEETKPLNKAPEPEEGEGTSPEEPKYFVLEPQGEDPERQALTSTQF